MARKADLMGLGLQSPLANVMATEPSTLVAVGATLASAAAIGGQQFLVSVTSGTSAVALPSIGGFSGCLLGDDFIINNQSGASIQVFAPGGVAISYNGSSVTGTTGVAVTNHTSVAFYPLTATSWMCIKGA